MGRCTPRLGCPLTQVCPSEARRPTACMHPHQHLHLFCHHLSTSLSLSLSLLFCFLALLSFSLSPSLTLLCLPCVVGAGAAGSAGAVQALTHRAEATLSPRDLRPPGCTRAHRQPAGTHTRAGEETEEVHTFINTHTHTHTLISNQVSSESNFLNSPTNLSSSTVHSGFYSSRVEETLCHPNRHASYQC